MNNTLFNGSIPNQYNDNKTRNLFGNQFNTIKKHIQFSSDIHLPLVFLGVLSCLIITASLLVIVLVYRNKQLRTTTNLYLACLAFVWSTVRPDCNFFDICLQSHGIWRQYCCLHCHGSCISVYHLLHDTASGDCHFCALCDDNPPTAVPQDHFQAKNSGFTDPHLDFFIEYVNYLAVLD